MKKFLLALILFSNSFLIAQNLDSIAAGRNHRLRDSILIAKNLDSIAAAEKEEWKDSIYSNRFNKGNYQIGGIPIPVISGGNADGFYPTGLGIHSEFGYFIKKRLLLMFENTTMYYRYEERPKTDENGYYFFSISSHGARYYLRPKRLSIFTQVFINYTYNSEDTEAVNDLPPISFSRLDIMPGIGSSFCMNRFEISLEVNYAIPLLYSKEVYFKHISYWGNKGLMPMMSLFFTF